MIPMALKGIPFVIDDQISGLRNQKQSERRSNNINGTLRSNNRTALRISVTSGKGGVGKSNFALNLAIVLSAAGRKVLLVDADTNLANLDILIGIHPEYNLSDVITGDRIIQDIIVQGPGEIEILPSSSGVVEMLDLDDQVQRQLIDSFTELEQRYDFIIIDTGAGLTPQIVNYSASADEVIVITTPEPTAIADAYAMLKTISHKNPTVKIQVLVNMVRSPKEAYQVFEGLNLVVQNFLNIPVDFLGYLPLDQNVSQSVAMQRPFVLEYPKCPASVTMRMMSRKILKRGSLPDPDKRRSMFARLLKLNRSK